MTENSKAPRVTKGRQTAAQSQTRAERESNLGRIIEDSLNEVYVFDAETLLFRLVNRGARENLGYTAEELHALTPIDIKPDYTRELFEEMLDRLRSGEMELVEFDTVHKRKDGSLYRVQVHLQRSSYEGRDAFVAIILDTTEKARVEEELKSTLARTSSIIDTAVDGILSIDERGTIESANPASLELFGYSHRELVGRNVKILMPSPHREEHDAYLANYLRTGVPRIIGRRRELLGRRHDGTHFPMELSVSEGRVHGRRIFTGVVRDLSERNEAERNLRRQSEIIDQVHDMLIATDAEGRITLWNRAAEATFGAPRASAIGSPISDFIPADVMTRAQAQLATSDRVDGRFELDTPTGRRVHDNTFQLLRDEAGNPAGAIAFSRDVSNLAAAEKKRLEAERRAQAAEELASLSTLTAGIAHDVGTPMQVILGYSQLLEKSLTDEKQKERARTIGEQVTRVTTLIQTLLNIARPNDAASVEVDLATILEASLDFFREKLRVHAIEVERRFEGVPMIDGDPDRLQQVFLNLLVNATDAMPQGGKLTVELDAPGDDWVHVLVSDTGTGMSAETRDHVFDPFFTTKERGKGTGLGLVVTRGIIVDHGGDIEVKSELGKGSSFALKFPVRPGAAEEGRPG